jgi:hypothetical protein
LLNKKIGKNDPYFVNYLRDTTLGSDDQRDQAEYDPDDDEMGKVADEIGEYHQNDAANQKYIVCGLFAVQKIPESDNAEKNDGHNPIHRRMAQGGIGDPFVSDTLPEII